MFFVKSGKKFYELNNSNTYALYPGCGEVHQVDIVDLLSSGHHDLEDTRVYCTVCSKQRQAWRKRHNITIKEEY